MAAVPRKVLAFSLMAVNSGIFGMEIVDKDMCTFCVEYCLLSDSCRHSSGVTFEIMCCILKRT